MEKESAFLVGFEKRAILGGMIEGAKKVINSPRNKAKTYAGMGLVGAALPVAAVYKGFDKAVDPSGTGNSRQDW